MFSGKGVLPGGRMLISFVCLFVGQIIFNLKYLSCPKQIIIKSKLYVNYTEFTGYQGDYILVPGVLSLGLF